MGEGAILIAAVDAIARETTLFAAIWFLVGGVDDLAVDLLYLLRLVRLKLARMAPPRLADLRAGEAGPIVIFVAAWDESAVIGAMLAATLDRYGAGDYRLYVGTYPNDPATVDAVAAIAERDARVRLVVGPVPGPTTKAGCLNTLWHALLRDEVAEGWRAVAVALHDAEDLVHPGELAVFGHYLGTHAAVQLPVLPLCDPKSRFVSGHYLDEFAEAHAKSLLVREAVGAGMPLAGVGCAIRRDMLARIAEARGGAPFDATSLTEDYELGLTIRAMGGRTVLARVPEAPGGPPVAVRAYFPATLHAAVRQKARWMTGIALAGWDRVGWGPARDLGEHWMRARDRRATLAIPVLAVAYFALIAWGMSLGMHAVTGGTPAMPDATLGWVLGINVALVAWRLAVRAGFVWQAYGLGEALLSVPRVLVANLVALLAARRALFTYIGTLGGTPPKWDKTTHHFPDAAESAAA